MKPSVNQSEPPARLIWRQNFGDIRSPLWPWLLTLLHPDDQERCTQTWAKSVRGGKPYQIQFRIRRFDGQYCWHQVQATPARDLDGHIVKCYGSAVEIPESAVTV